jgi:hypothetical protein
MNSKNDTPMEQDLRIEVQLTPIDIEDQLAALGWTASPKVSTLNSIRALARAVRPL